MHALNEAELRYLGKLHYSHCGFLVGERRRKWRECFIDCGGYIDAPDWHQVSTVKANPRTFRFPLQFPTSLVKGAADEGCKGPGDRSVWRRMLRYWRLHACRGNGGSEVSHSGYIGQASGHFTSHCHIHWICGVSKLLHRSENSADRFRNCRKLRTKLFKTEAY